MDPTNDTPITEPSPNCICSSIIASDAPFKCQQCQCPIKSLGHVEQKLADQAAEISRLKNALQQRDDAFDRLQLDVEALNKKYVAEIERVADVQHEKDLVEHELEELSCRLFEEANGMVAAEKREKWQLENQLRLTEEQLKAEQSQLSELRLRMQEMIARTESMHVTSVDDPNARARLDLEALHGVKRSSAHPTRPALADPRRAQHRAASMPPISSQRKMTNPLAIDEVQLAAFRDFVQSSCNMPAKKFNQFAYMKLCQVEDVEPCLRFGLGSRLSTRKMMDFLSRQSCFIEQTPDDDLIVALSSRPPTPPTSHVTNARPLWERLSSKTTSAHTVKCAACGRPASQAHPLSYRFRLDEVSEWLPIDHFCRDRLVAVCEFFVFIRNIQQGLYADRAIDDMYTENIRLRLQMFYSRMGALPVILDGMGLDPDAVGKASIPADAPLSPNDDDAYASDDSLADPSGPYTPLGGTPMLSKVEETGVGGGDVGGDSDNTANRWALDSTQ